MINFKVGDQVEYAFPHTHYSSYEKWAQHHNLTNFHMYATPNSAMAYEVVVTARHGGSGSQGSMILVGITDSQNDFIVSENSLKLVPPASPSKPSTKKKTNITTFKQGDKVKVTDTGCCLINGQSFANRHAMAGFTIGSTDLCPGEICEVVAVGYHSGGLAGQKIGIRSHSKQKSWVIDGNGLELASSTPANQNKNISIKLGNKTIGHIKDNPHPTFKPVYFGDPIPFCPKCNKPGDHTGMVYYLMDNVCKWL